MRHGSTGRKFGRKTKQRVALMRELAVALFKHGKITTTEAKAKSLGVLTDKLITKGKRADLHSTRYLVSTVGIIATKKITTEIAPRFIERHGGYTRIIKIPARVNDGARMAVIELVQ